MYRPQSQQTVRPVEKLYDLAPVLPPRPKSQGALRNEQRSASDAGSIQHADDVDATKAVTLPRVGSWSQPQRQARDLNWKPPSRSALYSRMSSRDAKDLQDDLGPIDDWRQYFSGKMPSHLRVSIYIFIRSINTISITIPYWLSMC